MDDDNNSIDIAVIEADMTRVSEAFKTSLSRLRAVGAHPEMLDGTHIQIYLCIHNMCLTFVLYCIHLGVQVMAYGSRTYLKNVAQVAVKDARTLSVNVFDSDVTTSVEKGIRSSGLNLNPVVDGSTSIRVPVPRADKNSRETLVRNAMGEAEKAKIATRHVRRDAMNDIKKMKDSLAKSEVKRIEKDVQKSTDKFVQLIEKVTQDKVKAIRDV